MCDEVDMAILPYLLLVFGHFNSFTCLFISPHLRGEEHIDFGADSVGFCTILCEPVVQILTNQILMDI